MQRKLKDSAITPIYWDMLKNSPLRIGDSLSSEISNRNKLKAVNNIQMCLSGLYRQILKRYYILKIKRYHLISQLTISDSLEGLGSVNEDSFLYSCKTKTELIEIANQNIGFFAECGIWIFSPNGKDWTRTCPEINNSASSWNDQLLKILSFYSDRVPHSEIRIAEVNSMLDM